MNSAKRGRNIGCSIITIILVLSAIAKFISAYQKSQYQSEHSNPKVYLNCPDCKPGIPIYDSWSTTRKIDSYGQNGDECEVTANYTYSYIKTLQPHAAYIYVDTEPHLFVRCPNGQGFVYTSHTTFTEPASISDNYCPEATLDAFVSASEPLMAMSDKLIQESSAETASLVVQEHAKIVEEFEALEVPPCFKAVRDETLLAFKSRQKAAEYAAAGDWSNVEKAWNEANSHFDRAGKLLDEAEACAKGIGPCP